MSPYNFTLAITSTVIIAAWIVLAVAGITSHATNAIVGGMLVVASAITGIWNTLTMNLAALRGHRLRDHLPWCLTYGATVALVLVIVRAILVDCLKAV